ncbi:MAG TPA: hypothetical protein VGG33_02180 [Polyangia bacterium]
MAVTVTGRRNVGKTGAPESHLYLDLPPRQGLLVAPALLLSLCTLGAGVVSGCRGRQASLGPAESYRLFAPDPGKAGVPGGPPVVRDLPLNQEPGLSLGRALNDGFAAEMVRIVHLAKQLVRHGGKTEARYPDAVRAAAEEPLCLVVGVDSASATSRGLGFATWTSVDARPETRWVGLSGNIEGDRALVQTLTGRLATHAADWVARGAVPGPTPLLVDAYRMAMEVIAREWKQSGQGHQGALGGTAGTLEQRTTFSIVRGNQAVKVSDSDAGALKTARELLADPRVAATVLHRLAQTRTLAHTAGPVPMYAPFVSTTLPAGVSPAQVLGPMRNFQAKLFSAWADAVGKGRPPADIVDLVTAYTDVFPNERAEVVRIFLVTTFAGTVIPGGLSTAAADATATLARLTTLTEDVVADKRGLRDALKDAGSPKTP